MCRFNAFILSLFFILVFPVKAQTLDAVLLKEMSELSTPVFDMNESELRALAEGKDWYERDPNRFDEHGLRLMLTDFGLDLAKLISTPVVSSLDVWNEFTLEEKSQLLLDKDDYYLTPFNPDLEVLSFIFDLQDVVGKHPSNLWPERLAEGKINTIKEFVDLHSPKIVEKLKAVAPLDFEYSGYYPGMDDENVPIGTIGDWYVSSHRVISLKDGSTLAHEIVIAHKGFMRWGDDRVFDSNIADHYNTLEEALAAGGEESDVCWSYSATFDSDLENVIYMEELPNWCGF